MLCFHILLAFSDDYGLYWIPEYYLVNPLHVVSQLLQVFDVTITNFADDESTLALAVRLSGLQGLWRLRGWWLWAGSWMSGDTSATGKRSDWNTGLTSARVVVSLTYALKKMVKFQNISFDKLLIGHNCRKKCLLNSNTITYGLKTCLISSTILTVNTILYLLKQLYVTVSF